jgi:murein tripeptide amidase MpaA
MRTKLFFALFIFFILVMNADAQEDWRTPAEKDDTRTTPTYAETRAFLERLDKTSNEIKLTAFGKTGEGRDLMLVIAARDNAFTPPEARRQGKIVVLVQACIHAGESDGKDAGLALLRDIAINKKRADLLDKAVVLFEPIYNADGHENRSPFKRINQNGPEETGWRGNARNINLNRDYIKADEPETRAWLRLWNEWQPDFFVDCHVTDGADYQYDLTYQFEHHETVAPALKNWLETAIEKRAVAATEKQNHLLAPYLEFVDNRDFSKGISEFLSTPRFATGYPPLVRNRPAVLIETHMLKPYKQRVVATYDFLVAMLAEINQNPQALREAIRQADAESAARRLRAGENLPLSLKLTNKSTEFELKAVASRVEKSEISGADWVRFDNSKPVTLTIPFFNQTAVAESITLPAAYVVPPQWRTAIELLELHGVQAERLTEPRAFEVETYRLSQPKWATASFESRVMLRDFKTEKITETKTFPAGSVLVKIAQPNGKAAVHLLEPLAPDSLVRWGFFNSIFEQKEYGESYVLEKLAREMLAKDAKLKAEFEEKLKTDKDFAASPRARLNFFFERSPYFDKNIGAYPVARINKL